MRSTPDSPNVVWQGYPLATWVQRLAAHLTDFLLAGGSIMLGTLGLAIMMASVAGDELVRDPDHLWIRGTVARGVGVGAAPCGSRRHAELRGLVRGYAQQRPNAR